MAVTCINFWLFTENSWTFEDSWYKCLFSNFKNNFTAWFYRHLSVIYIIENFEVAKARIWIHFVRSFSIRFKRDLNPLLMLSVTMPISHCPFLICKRTSLILKAQKEQPRASSHLPLTGHSCLQWEQTGLYQSMNSMKVLLGLWIHSDFFSNLKRVFGGVVSVWCF